MQRLLDDWELVWTVPPKPPVHPTEMTGRQRFKSFSDAVNFFAKAPKGSVIKSLTQIIEDRKDFTEDARKRVEWMKKEKNVDVHKVDPYLYTLDPDMEKRRIDLLNEGDWYQD